MSTNLYFNDGIQTIDLINVFSHNVGNSNNTSSFVNSGVLDTHSSTGNNSANSSLTSVLTTGYKISGQDITTVFSPIYFDVTTDGISTINVPSWVSRIGFVVQGAGGTGGAGYTDSYRAQYFRATFGQAANFAQGADWRKFEGFFCFKKWNQGGHLDHYYNYVNSFRQVQNSNYYYYYQAAANSYCGKSGAGGGCVAGIYNVQTGKTSSTSANSMTLTLGFNQTTSTSINGVTNRVHYITFNDSGSNPSTVIAQHGGNETPNPTPTTTGGSNTTTDTGGKKGCSSHYEKGNATAIASTSDSTTSITNNGGGNFIKVYHQAGEDGLNPSPSNAASIAGGGSGFSKSTTMQTSFYPNITTSKGQGGTGYSSATNETGDNGIIRYWYIR